MPYISQNDRMRLHEAEQIQTVGELTYIMTRAINDFILSNGCKFKTFAQVLGALESTKCEFERRILIPYEEVKMAENGDVYDEELRVMLHNAMADK